MVAVAQLVEPRLVVPVVAGSSPVSHPIPSCAQGASVPPRRGCYGCRGYQSRCPFEPREAAGESLVVSLWHV